jgi:2,4-dienoyl-CoA reductase-like NADH-dependent reductase (Old Yellow Enzyme family)
MDLFDSLDINGMTVPNRVVVPAMVTRLSGEDGKVNDSILERYVRYAQGEVGLIVAEAMAIHGGKAGPLLRISDDSFIPGLSELARRVHAASDSKIVPQIIHFMKVARTGWRQTFDMLSEADLELIIEQFGDAAVRARQAGFDGIELHAAHAYTLSTSLSRVNPRRDAYDGRSLEGRLLMFGQVMANVRGKVGADFPVGVRFNADEFIRGGYTVEDSKLMALRMAQLGVDFISLSVGGKFEDAVHTPGKVLHGYTGYSGDRCMPGIGYPALPHIAMMAEIKAFINAKGYRVPVIGAGKIADPDDARRIISEEKLDLVAIARGLLADPDWPKKVRRGEADRIVHCDYCNVCKQLDGDHKEVICALWPKGARQAPSDQPAGAAPAWGADRGGLSVELADGAARLEWHESQGEPVCYYIYRTDDGGPARRIEALKGTHWVDRTVFAGTRYDFHVRAQDAVGRTSPPSNTVTVTAKVPTYGGHPASVIAQLSGGGA